MVDRAHAEALLFDLAADLRLVPVEETTRALHIRALQLKANVVLWSADSPDEGARRAVCAEIAALHEQARDCRRRMRSGRQLAVAASADGARRQGCGGP
ncbi:MAG TPA: hypothetical protein VE987_09310 [Polyangiaceae bacterium]|nr:hypothetical protein [Polyangiaceae bacterium]